MTFGICESLNAHDYREMISIIKFLIVINLKVDLYNTLRYMIIGEIIALVAINGKQMLRGSIKQCAMYYFLVV